MTERGGGREGRVEEVDFHSLSCPKKMSYLNCGHGPGSLMVAFIHLQSYFWRICTRHIYHIIVGLEGMHPRYGEHSNMNYIHGHTVVQHQSFFTSVTSLIIQIQTSAFCLPCIGVSIPLCKSFRYMPLHILLTYLCKCRCSAGSRSIDSSSVPSFFYKNILLLCFLTVWFSSVQWIPLPSQPVEVTPTQGATNICCCCCCCSLLPENSLAGTYGRPSLVPSSVSVNSVVPSSNKRLYSPQS